MQHQVQIDLCLFANSVAPSEISSRLGVKPDAELLRGQRDSRLDLPRQNIWSLRSAATSNDVGDHWNSIFGRLEERWASFVEIAKHGEARITIIVDASRRLPSVMVPPRMSQAAAELSAIIDIDYCQ